MRTLYPQNQNSSLSSTNSRMSLMKKSYSIFIITVICLISPGINSRELIENKLVRLSPDDSGNSTHVHKMRKHIIIATIELEPFMMKRRSSDGESIEWFGYCMDFFDELIKHLPYELTYEIYQVSDNKFGTNLLHSTSGSNLSNSKQAEKWNGLIGDLYKNKAHLALAPLAVMAERELAIDFTVPFYDLVGIQILLKRPEVPKDWFKFLTVLDTEVWFCITMAYFVTSFIMFLFDRLSPYSHKNATRIKKLKRNQKVSLQRNMNLMRGDQIHTIGGSMKPSDMIDRLDGTGIQDTWTGYFPSVRDHMGPDVKPEGRRSSVMMMPGSRSKLNSLTPLSGDFNGIRAQRHARGSRVILDNFLKGINLQRSHGGTNPEEIDSSDLDDGKPEFGFKDSLWFCVTSLTPQGGGEAPQNLSGRIVAGAWWLFCFIIIASYTANLAAFLTVSRLDIPIESLDDLAKQYRIKYAPIDGSAEQTYFERMAYIEEIFYNLWKDMSLNESLSEEERSKFAVWDYPISDKYTKIWAQVQQVGMPADTKTAISRVKSSTLDDGFALLADANIVRYAVMTDCNLKAVGEEFSRKPVALGVQKGDDQFRDDLSYAILQLINQRFMEILREKWWTNNPDRVTCNNNDESEGISVENIVGVFIVIFAGVALSFLVWMIERLIYRTKIRVSKDLISGS